jgi:hypothetical protein
MMGCQHVDAASAIHAVFIGFVPCSLRDVHDAGQNTWRDAAGQDESAASVIDFDLVAVFDVSLRRVDGIHEHTLGERFLQPVIVVMRGVDAV